MKAVKLISALALLGASTLTGAADVWSSLDYGNVSVLPGATMGNWQLSGETWKQTVFKGESQECAKGSTNCTQTYEKGVSFNWTWGVNLDTSFTIIPDVWSVGVTAQYS